MRARRHVSEVDGDSQIIGPEVVEIDFVRLLKERGGIGTVSAAHHEIGKLLQVRGEARAFGIAFLQIANPAR